MIARMIKKMIRKGTKTSVAATLLGNQEGMSKDANCCARASQLVAPRPVCSTRPSRQRRAIQPTLVELAPERWSAKPEGSYDRVRQFSPMPGVVAGQRRRGVGINHGTRTGIDEHYIRRLADHELASLIG